MVTVTVAVEEQVPFDTVTVYVVVEVGVATGFAIAALLRLAAGLQLYVVPPLAFSVVLLPEQIVTGDPALATGPGVTVTVTVAVAVQPDDVPVTVYVVVAEGVATGLAMFALLNPVDGLQV